MEDGRRVGGASGEALGDCDVAFPISCGLRVEVERGALPFADWWRARVRGGESWEVPDRLPWSYGTSDEMAIDAALSLWAAAGRPGSGNRASDVRPHADTVPAPRTAEGDRAARVIGRGGGEATLTEYAVRESVQTAVRAVGEAVAAGASTLQLTLRDGRTLALEVGSLVELRDDHIPAQ